MKCGGMMVLGSLILLLGALPIAAQTKTTATASPEALYARSKPSVVTIVTFDANRTPISQGSGFIVAKNRVVTNYHVIAGSTAASVAFSDGSTATATGVISGGEAKDLVVVEVKTGSRPALVLGDELQLKVGDTVYAIGAPKGLSASLSNGLVSAFRQDEGRFLIQITAAIAPGSSGGPLFNSQGQVVGVTTSQLKDGGFGFAIGAGDVQRLLKVPLAVKVQFSDLVPHDQEASQPQPSEALAEATKWIKNTFDANTGAMRCEGAIPNRGPLNAEDFLKKWDWSDPWFCVEQNWGIYFEGDGCSVEIVSLRKTGNKLKKWGVGEWGHWGSDDAFPDYDLIFNLRDIDPSSIKSEGPQWDSVTASALGLDFRTTNDENVIRYVFINARKERKEVSPIHALLDTFGPGPIIAKPDYAPRFIKAFRTAVEACGGKPSPF